jgi:hypothetical protein
MLAHIAIAVAIGCVTHLSHRLQCWVWIGIDRSQYIVYKAPRLVLDDLERVGFRVVGSAGVGQTLLWTLQADKYPDEQEA